MSRSAVNNREIPKEMPIAVIGLGHVGLPTALGLADLGWKVIGADQNAEAIRRLREGKSTFYEPGLAALLAKHSGKDNFMMTDDVEHAIQAASVLFICVGTPQRENGEADLSQIEVIGRLIARNLNQYKLIVEKSTVPANTARWLKRTIERYSVAHVHSGEAAEQKGHASRTTHPFRALEFDVASNPEFLQEGKAVENFLRPDRIIVGVESRRAERLLRAIYEPLKRPILVTDVTTAELTKHAANAFLAMKISYANVVADICEAVGANITLVSQGIGLDPRIGQDFLSAGIGFGGYCFPKDLRAFIHLAEERGVPCSILREVEQINHQRVQMFLKKIRQALWIVQEKTIGIWGLAFKPNTDDIREAPSIKIIDALLNEGARLRLYDPQAMTNMKRIFPERSGQVCYCPSAYQACEDAHAVLLLTEWDEFRSLDLRRVAGLMALPVLLDGRNVFTAEQVAGAGLEYISVGRKATVKPIPTAPPVMAVPSPAQIEYAGIE
jgi:UDPglucose 6-dehydrogenase